MVQAKDMPLKDMRSKPISPAPLKHQSQAEKDKDAAVVSLIHGVSLLIAHARRSGIGKAIQILSTAKEDLVYWAVDMNFHEAAEDHFINRHMHGIGTEVGNELLHCIANVNGAPDHTDIARELNTLITRIADLAVRSSIALAISKKDYD